MAPLCIAYYCSGHGYGHATRVSAFASHLRLLDPPDRPTIYIVSSAPQLVFADSIARGALYRYAEIDPVIVQPLAYRVDRQKSVEVLQSFLSQKDSKLEQERRWLIEICADAVLSDAAFLGCLAANSAGIPSILITNFTFDSVYSYLSTPLLDDFASSALSPHHQDHLHASSHHRSHHHQQPALILHPDTPIPSHQLDPLVFEIQSGYRCADLHLRLPGYIPIPSFSIYPPLPASNWVNPKTGTLEKEVLDYLEDTLTLNDSRDNAEVSEHSRYPLYPPVPMPPSVVHRHRRKSSSRRTRQVIPTPLLVRSPTSPDVYTLAGRTKFLASIGVPESVLASLGNHDHPESTHLKVLIVSFGGQVFHRPSRNSSRSTSRHGSRASSRNENRERSTSLVNGRDHHSSIDRTTHSHLASSTSKEDRLELDVALHPSQSRTLSSQHDSLTSSLSRLYLKESSTEVITLSSPKAKVPSKLKLQPNGIGLGIAVGSDTVDRPATSADTSSNIVEADTLINTHPSPIVHGPSPQVPPPQPLPDMDLRCPRSATPLHMQAISPRLATPSHIWIPGAPPASKPLQTPTSPPALRTFPPTPRLKTPRQNSATAAYFDFDRRVDPHPDETDELEDDLEWEGPRLLPDSSWIAIVCGVSKEQWNAEGEEPDELPEGFYVAPKDVYMPDLTAVGDVLLGKLGYGTVSECVDSCTPFVYVSRPLFIEEHGLRLLLDRDGVGVELSRESYEAGDWASAVEDAWGKGRTEKEVKRKEGEIGLERRREEGRKMALMVIRWVKDWWGGLDSDSDSE